VIAPARPWSALDYVRDVYARERLDLSEGSRKKLETDCRILDLWNDGKPFLLDEFSREAVIDWMRWLAEHHKSSPATINSKRAGVMAIWADAAAKGYAPPLPNSRDPQQRVPKRIEPERIPVTWSLAEIDRLFAACAKLKGQWDGVPVSLCWITALLLFWDTAGRLFEVVSAKVRCLDVDRKFLFCPAEDRKGRRRDRIYPLHQQTIDLYKATLPGAPGISGSRDLVFPFPYCRRQLQIHLTKLLKLAGLPHDAKHKFHCIRRSAESYAAAERGLQWAADAVGHSAAVARKSYVSPVIAPGPVLIDALPRPALPL